MAIPTKGSSKSSRTPSDSEKLSYDSLAAAEVVLGEAITAALKSLPRSTSLTHMMDSLRINSEPGGASGKLACAGDFVEWWRRL